MILPLKKTKLSLCEFFKYKLYLIFSLMYKRKFFKRRFQKKGYSKRYSKLGAIVAPR